MNVPYNLYLTFNNNISFRDFQWSIRTDRKTHTRSQWTTIYLTHSLLKNSYTHSDCSCSRVRVCCDLYCYTWILLLIIITIIIKHYSFHINVMNAILCECYVLYPYFHMSCLVLFCSPLNHTKNHNILFSFECYCCFLGVSNFLQFFNFLIFYFHSSYISSSLLPFLHHFLLSLLLIIIVLH